MSRVPARGTRNQVLEGYRTLSFQSGKAQDTEGILIMAKCKRKVTAVEKAEKKRRQQEYMAIFINGRQKQVKRPPTIDGMDPDEFILRNADPIWLHQNEMWEYLTDDEKS